jgi:DNA-binding beta-propeller fold protein YncE
VGTRGPKQPGSFNNPRDVAYRNGRLYVADTGYNRVQVLNAKTGAWIATWPHQFQSVIGIGAGPNGHGGTVILTADDDANTVAEWTTTGKLVAQIAAPLGKGNGQLDEPRDADTDSHGNIYVADFANDRMAKFGPGGKWLRNWGTKGAANGQFARPYGVAIDATDHVYVADSNNERIQEFTRKGRDWPSGAGPATGPASSRSSEGLQWEAALIPRSTAPTSGATTSAASSTAAPSCTGGAPTTRRRAASTSLPGWRSARRRMSPTPSTSAWNGSPRPPACSTRLGARAAGRSRI